MCLILFAWRAHPVYSLVVAANRDEYYARPAKQLAWWGTEPDIAAGRDLEAGGTWLGMARTGRFAAVTNVREPGRSLAHARSRGELVTDFLASQDDPQHHFEQLDGAEYNGFNVLAGAGSELWWFSNRGARASRVEPGLHGLSNALLDTPWPKVTGGVAAFGSVLATDDGGADPAEYFAVLADRHPAGRANRPKTGVPPRVERALSARFVAMRGYGTRASTVLRVRHDGSFELSERTFRRGGTSMSSVQSY